MVVCTLQNLLQTTCLKQLVSSLYWFIQWVLLCQCRWHEFDRTPLMTETKSGIAQVEAPAVDPKLPRRRETKL